MRTGAGGGAAGSSGGASPRLATSRTPWNETSLFDPSLGYTDYLGWATLAGRLGARYRQFTAVNVDDFSHNVGVGMSFTPNIIARMSSALRGQGAPWMGLASCVYYSQDGVWSLGRWPDLPMVLDASISFFRNEFQGIGPCVTSPQRQCPWGALEKPPLHPPPTAEGLGSCLAGACADTTAINAPFEVAPS